ncbi:MAG: ABC transporter permease, partial [Planctomycetaceae bacterium]|nr:ABC transporter permease [Planctomycetaceae bacterium]
ANAGSGKELVIIAAVVIGGGSLSGGRGSVIGTLTGAAMIFVIQSGCTHLGFDNAYQDMLLGLIIITAVIIDQYRQNRLANT